MKLEDLERVADKSLSEGNNNLAIVLYAYLGAHKAGAGGIFAEHCQEFCREGLKEIEKNKIRNN